MPDMARYFEELKVGEVFEFPEVELTAALRAGHVALYGEDWAAENLAEDPSRARIIPSPLVMALLAAANGRMNAMRMLYMKEQRLRCLRPLFIGDYARIKKTIRELRPHRDTTKNYGYVFFDYEVSNQQGERCYAGEVCLLVERRTA